MRATRTDAGHRRVEEMSTMDGNHLKPMLLGDPGRPSTTTL